ncbi:hypothetical protein JHW43_003892 [Diplocarpon mali]|nr:hypothetical protein JHW43_003892 [Diplocarpon mali]
MASLIPSILLQDPHTQIFVVGVTFLLVSFLKPHTGDGTGNGQQNALESSYKTQADVYDVTRKKLLRGREDILEVMAAQLVHKAAKARTHDPKRIWIGGGTGWNIEAMSEFIDVGEFFSSVYLADFSPPLCEVSRKRFARLAWKNVKVVCQDARKFCLEDHEILDRGVDDIGFALPLSYFSENNSASFGADLVTLSYSLSAIELYRESLIATSNGLGAYFRELGSTLTKSVSKRSVEITSMERLDAAATESSYLSPMNHTSALSRTVERSSPAELRSKAWDAAIINLSANLPLPSLFYQNHHWEIHHDDQLKKHIQFGHEYIYAFTWEDTRVDHRLLKLTSSDVVLAITSAGDNIFSYALSYPARTHAVDLNPNQNNLLELKAASFTALSYADAWKLFGQGKHPGFHDLLISRLSPHMSSRAFQYWLNNTHVFTSARGKVLYETGGSRHAIRVIRLLAANLRFSSQNSALLEAKTLNEQREI